MPKNVIKKCKIAPLLTFLTKQRKFSNDFTPDWIFFTPTLLDHWYIFASLITVNGILGKYPGVMQAMGNNVAPIIDRHSFSYLDNIKHFIRTSLF